MSVKIRAQWGSVALWVFLSSIPAAFVLHRHFLWLTLAAGAGLVWLVISDLIR